MRKKALNLHIFLLYCALSGVFSASILGAEERIPDITGQGGDVQRLQEDSEALASSGNTRQIIDNSGLDPNTAKLDPVDQSKKTDPGDALEKIVNSLLPGPQIVTDVNEKQGTESATEVNNEDQTSGNGIKPLSKGISTNDKPTLVPVNDVAPPLGNDIASKQNEISPGDVSTMGNGMALSSIQKPTDGMVEPGVDIPKVLTESPAPGNNILPLESDVSPDDESSQKNYVQVGNEPASAANNDNAPPSNFAPANDIISQASGVPEVYNEAKPFGNVNADSPNVIPADGMVPEAADVPVVNEAGKTFGKADSAFVAPANDKAPETSEVPVVNEAGKTFYADSAHIPSAGDILPEASDASNGNDAVGNLGNVKQDSSNVALTNDLAPEAPSVPVVNDMAKTYGNVIAPTAEDNSQDVVKPLASDVLVTDSSNIVAGNNYRLTGRLPTEAFGKGKMPEDTAGTTESYYDTEDESVDSDIEVKEGDFENPVNETVENKDDFYDEGWWNDEFDEGDWDKEDYGEEYFDDDDDYDDNDNDDLDKDEYWNNDEDDDYDDDDDWDSSEYTTTSTTKSWLDITTTTDYEYDLETTEDDDDDYDDDIRIDAEKGLMTSGANFDNSFESFADNKVSSKNKRLSYGFAYSWTLLLTVCIVIIGVFIFWNRHKVEKYIVSLRQPTPSNREPTRGALSRDEEKNLLDNEYA